MDKPHPLSPPMILQSLKPKDDSFRPCEEDEEIHGPEVPYLSAIGALMYLANNTRPDIAFTVNLLARYSNSPTKRHWSGIKHLLRYLRGTKDLGLFYRSKQDATLVGYADAGYLSDPHKAKSQNGYVFTYEGTAISWRSTKQTLTATSSNHAESIALYEASRECV
ncbi:secreted RxLR effector protein 161-like [Amaranthus tricolor]|uniref:secreted RxLR effector protein 161-like n=1 Tax=Amaranthus tricolor TaxID=29722 RepID=UPI0025911153|nr:secreted RxLR effector protein 161-like [Amaranthus tricolor]